MSKATGRRLRRYPAQNRGKSTVVQREDKFVGAEAPFCLPVASVNVEARHREASCAKQVRGPEPSNGVVSAYLVAMDYPAGKGVVLFTEAEIEVDG